MTPQVPLWQEIAKPLLDAQVPDNVYDAQRDAYYEQYVLPAALKAGESPTKAKENFLKASERPGKSSMPRTALVGASALKALTDPLKLIMDPETAQNFSDSNKEMVGNAAREAARQGISPTPYTIAGDLLGSAPYFVGGFGAARGVMAGASEALVARGVSETAAKIATEAAVGGAIQGAYDAAKADEGHRLEDGLHGAAVGATLVGGLLSLGPLKRALMSQHNLPEEVAAAVEATAKGSPTPVQEALAAQAPPEVQQTIQQYLTEQVQAAKRAGLPKDAMFAEPGGRVKVQLKTADGKTYNVGGVTGVDVQNIGTLVDRISPHLDQGGEILSVNGDPSVLQALQQNLERVNRDKGFYKAAEAPVKTAGDVAAEAASAGPKPEVPSLPTKPTPSAGAATPEGLPPVVKLGEEEWKLTDGGWYEAADGRVLPAHVLDARGATPVEGRAARKPKPEQFEQMGQYVVPSNGEPIQVYSNKPGFGSHDEWLNNHPDEHHLAITVSNNSVSFTPGRGVRNLPTALELAAKNAEKLGLDTVEAHIWGPGQEHTLQMDLAELKANGYSFVETPKIPIGRPARADEEFMKIIRDKHAAAVAMGDTETAASLEQRFGPFEKRTMGQAPPTRSSIQRPTQFRSAVDRVAGDSSITGITYVEPGGMPRITYQQDSMTPDLIFHETLHGGFGNTGLAEDFTTLEQLGGPWRKMLGKLSNAWPLDVQVAYRREGHVGEEVYAYLAAAIRTNDEKMIGKFVEADESREQVMRWAAETTDTLLDSLAQTSDSVHKRVLERKMREVFRRSTNELRDITGDTADVYGVSVDVLNGKYVVRNPEGKLYHFSEKEQLIDFLEKNYGEPLSTPSLVDETVLPADVPRMARKIPPHSIGKVPAGTPPPTMEAPGAEDMGGALASFFFRPFYPWIDTVAKKMGRPELYDMFKGLDTKMVQRDAFIEHYENPLKRALVGKSLIETKYSPSRQKDLYMYLQAKPGFEQAAEQKFGITPQEKIDLASLQADVLDPLAADSGLDFLKYVREVAPLVRRTADPDQIRAGVGGLTQREADFWKNAILKGEIDPFDQDLLRTSHAYVRLVARDKTLGTDLDLIQKVIDEKTPDGMDYRLGAVRPLLKRQLEYIKGRPDYTQRLLDGATKTIINMINKGLDSVNAKLPDSMQIPTIEAPPQDVLGRWILYSYAGGLALRPMVVFRDSMQLFLTTFPMLGGKYLTRGLQRSFPALKEGVESDAWRIADQYGALMHQSDLQNLYSGGYEQLASGGKVTGKITNFAEGSLKWLQWSNNSNRLVTFWGHAEKNLDALAKNVPSQNAKGLIKDAGWQFLDDRLRDNLVQEAMQADAGKWHDIAYRAAKELTDISQWNYRRGASPGIYKYSMGRLFGQYGTWPLNYIEYARRLASKGDAGDKAAALTRLALAHGAVLKTGELFGIDTGQWVFTQPMAYGGSPLFSAVVNLPGTMDFESYRGAEARRELARIIWPMEVPGGLAAEKIYKAITADSPTALQEALGFQPMKSGEEEKGIHSLIP